MRRHAGKRRHCAHLAQSASRVVPSANSQQERRWAPSNIQSTQNQPICSRRTVQNGRFRRCYVHSPSRSSASSRHHTLCHHRHQRRVHARPIRPSFYPVSRFRGRQTLVRPQSSPVWAEVLARCLGKVHLHLTRRRCVVRQPCRRHHHPRSFRHRSARPRNIGLGNVTSSRHLPQYSEVHSVPSTKCRIPRFHFGFLRPRSSIHCRPIRKAQVHPTRRCQTSKGRLRVTQASGPSTRKGSCSGSSVFSDMSEDIFPLSRPSIHATHQPSPRQSDSEPLGHCATAPNTSTTESAGSPSIACRPTLAITPAPTPTNSISPSHRCQRPQVGSSDIREGVGGILHRGRTTSPHHRQRDTSLLARPPDSTTLTSRDSHSPLRGQSTSFLRSPSPENQVPPDARPTHPSTRAMSPSLPDPTATLGPEPTQPSGCAQQSSTGLGRLSLPPTATHPRSRSASPPLTHDRLDGVVQQPVLPQIHQQRPATGSDLPGCVLSPSVQSTGQTPVLQSTVASSPTSPSTLQHNAPEPTTPTGDPGVVSPALAHTLGPTPSSACHVPTSLGDLLRSIESTDASSEMVKRYISHLWQDYDKAGENTALLSLWVLMSPQVFPPLARSYARALRHMQIEGCSDTDPVSFMRFLFSLTKDSDTQVTAARDYYCAFVRFPSFRDILRHGDFKRWRSKHLFTATVKFYDLHALLETEPPLVKTDKYSVRWRLVLCLSIYHLARAIDLSRLSRTVREGDAGIMFCHGVAKMKCMLLLL